MTARFAIVLLLAGVGPLLAQTPEGESILYLRKLQTAEGGFRASSTEEKPSLRATSGAIRALHYLGGKANHPDAAARFVARCFDSTTGGFTDRPGEGKPDVFTTAVGLMAVVELKLPLEKYTPALEFLERNARGFEEIRIAAAGFEAAGKLPGKAGEWRRLLSEMRNADGTFGKGADQARATGGAVAAQLRLGEKIEDRPAIVKTLQAGQREDGGFGKEGVRNSDLETTYRVVRSFVMLSDKPDGKKVLAFVNRCRNDDGGYGVTPGAKSSVSGTYYAAILRHWLDGK